MDRHASEKIFCAIPAYFSLTLISLEKNQWW